MADNTPDLFLQELNRIRELDKQGQSPEGQADLARELGSLNLYGVAATAGTPLDPNHMGPVESMLRAGDMAGLEAYTGSPETAQLLWNEYNKAHTQVQDDLNRTRTGYEAFADNASSAGQTIVNTIWGLGTIGASLLNPEWGEISAGANALFNEDVESQKSEAFQGRRRWSEAVNQRKNQESEAKALEEAAAGNSDLLPSLVAWTKQIGRDAATSIDVITSDSMLLQAGSSEAAASLLTSVGMSKALGTLSKQVVARTAARTEARLLAQGFTQSAARAQAQKSVEALSKHLGKVEWGTAVGTQEGAGAFQEAFQNVVTRDFEDLMERSEPFRQRVAELRQENPNLSDNDIMSQARRELAREVALASGAGTGLAAGVLGAGLNYGTRKVFGNSPAGVIRNMATEAIEEGGTGLLGGTLQNALIQSRVDSDQTLAEGVGRQLGEGALLGGISAGMVGGPGALVRAPQTARDTINAVADVRNQRDRNKATASLVERANTLPALKVNAGSMEARRAAAPALNNLVNTLSVDNVPASVSSLAPKYQKLVPQGASRADAITKIAKALNKETDPEQQQALALTLNELIEPTTKFTEVAPEIQALQDPALNETVQQYQDVLGEMSQIAEVHEALQKTDTVLAEAVQEITPEFIKTPEGRKAADTLLAHVTRNPTGIKNLSVSTVETVLEDRRNNLTPSQTAALQGTLALLRAREATQTTPEILGRHTDSVGRQITSLGGIERNSLEGGRYSALQHADAVIKAATQGKREEAKAYLEDFGLFVQHMDNKVNALNQHYEEGGNGRVAYQQLMPDRTWQSSETNPVAKYKGAFVNKKSESSLAFARTVHEESQLLHNIFNNLAQAYPELGVATRAATPIHSDLAQNQNQVTQQAPTQDAQVAQDQADTAITETVPVRTKIENFFNSLERPQRERNLVTDSMTGAYSEAGARMLPVDPKNPILVVFSLEGKKQLNDLHGHDALDGALKRMAKIASQNSKMPMKIGGDVQAFVSSIQEAERVAQLMAEAVGYGQVMIGTTDRTKHHGFDGALKAANDDLGAKNEAARKAGLFAYRKSPPVAFFDAAMPAGINWDYDAKEGNTDGVNPASPEVQAWLQTVKEKTADLGKTLAEEPTVELLKTLNPKVLEAVNKLSDTELFEQTYYEPGTGLLTEAGFKVASEGKQHFASLDLRSLKLMNSMLGKAEADYLMQTFGSILVAMGGKELAASHLHGDEYAMAADDLLELKSVIAAFEEALNSHVFYKTVLDKNGQFDHITIQDGLSFAWGVGPTLKEADSVDLARRKEADQAAGKRIAEAIRYSGEYGAQLADFFGATGAAIDLGRVSDRRSAERGVSQAGQETGGQVSVRSSYPGLVEVQGKVRNFFKDNFKFRKNGTRLTGDAAPVRTLRSVLSSEQGAKEFLGSDSKNSLSSEVRAAYQNLLKMPPNASEVLRKLKPGQTKPEGLRTVGGILGALDNQLQDFLNREDKRTPKIKRAGEKKARHKTFGEQLFDGDKEFTAYANGKTLNFVENVNGKFRYNPELIQQAALGAIQWSLVASQKSAFPSEEEVAKALGMEEGELPSEVIAALSEGEDLDTAKSSLTNYIQRFMGVQPDKTKPYGQADAVIEALASELLNALEASGFVQVKTVDLTPYVGQTKTVHRYIAHDWDTETEVSPLYRYPGLLEELVVPEPEQATFYGDDVVPVLPTVLGNNKVKLSKESAKARKAMQDQKFYLNLPMVDAVLSLDDNKLLELFGQGLPEDRNQREKLFNREDLASRESRDILLLGAFKELRRTVAEMRGIAEQQGISIQEVGKKYQYAVTSVNRIMMLGAHNPQANKLMREMIMPTWSTLDLVNNQEHINYFMQAMAQAIGLKVHKNSLENNAVEAKKLLDTELAPAVGVLTSWLQGRDHESVLNGQLERPFPVAEFKAAMESTDIPVNPLTVMALIEWARYTMPGAKLESFRTPLYLESDGMTNGPFNTIGLLSTGMFRPEDIDNMRRGGLHIGSQPLTADQMQGLTGNKDLYQAGVDNAQIKVQNLLNSIKTQSDKKAAKEVANTSNALFTAMDLLFGSDVNWIQDEGKLELKRGIGKNPMTVLVYGSSEKGIANKFTQNLTAALYEKLSVITKAQAEGKSLAEVAELVFPGDADALNKLNKLFNSIVTLGTHKVVHSSKEKNTYSIFVDNNTKDRLENARDFKFSKTELKNIQQTALTLFVEPLTEGIKEVMGPNIFASNEEIIAITNTQVEIATKIYHDAIEARLNEKVQERIAQGVSEADAKVAIEREFLSHKELDDIWESLSDIMPLVSTSGQNFLIAKSEPLAFLSKRVQKDGTQSQRFDFSRALNDTKRTFPTLRTMVTPGVAAVPYLVQGLGDGRMVRRAYETDGLENSIQVYDGINIPIDRIPQYGQIINKAAFDAWRGNVYKDLAVTWNRFYSNPQVKEHISKLKPDEQKEIGKYSQILERLALDMDARQGALSEVSLSFDQMAGTYNPFVVQRGDELDNATSAEIADALNEKYLTLLSGETEPFDFFEGRKRHVSGAYVLGKTAIQQLPKTMGRALNSNETQILGEILRSKSLPNNLKVVMGTRKEISQYQANQGLSSLAQITEQNPNGTVNGFYSAQENTIYVMNSSPETLIHELIHASTYGAVEAVYRGQTDGETKAAVNRLEKLMELFLSGDYDLEGTPAEAAYRSAKAQIESYLSENALPEHKAAALNEFMAWTLANQELQIELKSQYHPLVSLAKNAYDAIKRLIWGRKKAPEFGGDILSQIRFNTAIIARSAPNLQTQVNEIALAHSILNGTQDKPTRAGKALRNFSNKVAKHLTRSAEFRAAQEVVRDSRMEVLTAKTTALKTEAQSIFSLTEEAADAFELQVGSTLAGVQLDPHVYMQAQKAFDHFVKNISPNDFLTNEGDPQNDAYLAQQKYEFLTRKGDRAALIPTFMALASVDDRLNRVLAKLPPPPGRGTQTVTGMNSLLENLQNLTMDKLEAVLSGSQEAKNTAQLMDILNQQLIGQSQGALSRINQLLETTDKLGYGANAKLVGMMDRTGVRMGKVGSNLMKSPNAFKKTVGSAIRATAILASEEQSDIVADEILAWADKNKNMFAPVRELIFDILGRTTSQGVIYDKVKEVRKMVSQIRSQFREKVPAVILKQFKIAPTSGQLDTMHRVMGRYDMASLLDTMSINKALDVISNSEIRKEQIALLEEALSEEAHFTDYMNKIDQYVNFVKTGVHGPMLLRNAHAIAHLLGSKKTVTPTASLITTIDQLITLKLIDQASDVDLRNMNELIEREPDGVSYVLSYLKGQRKTELSKALSNNKAKFNHYKGVLPTKRKDRGHLVVQPDHMTEQLTKMGYVRLDAYRGSNIAGGGKRSYFYSSEGGIKTPFNQGIAQNVRSTAYGVHTETGFSTNMGASLITDPVQVTLLKEKLQSEEPGIENLSPVFNDKGQIWAFEETLNPKMTARLEGPQNLAAMLGEWKGRQVEEVQAKKANEALLEALDKLYEDDIKSNSGAKDRYVNVLESDDPVIQDAVSILPKEIRSRGQLMVRRNLVNTVIGYRNASVGDLWTKNNRWNPETRRALRSAFEAILGTGAYRKALWAEQNWQSVISSVKTNIVVRSVVVPMANFLSGIYQLRARGIPMHKVLKAVPAKTTEINYYVKAMAQIVELDSHIYAADGNPFKMQQLQTRKEALEDSIRKLSIWPLIQSGEFSTISEVGGQPTVDFDVHPNNIMEKIEKAVDKLPPGLRDFARQGYMSQDTELFQILLKATQYSDFVMKAIYFDHLTQVEGKTEQAAKARVTEEFINYDIPVGRTRQYMESMGMAWFLNYKLRSAKIALSMIRNNPLDLLLYTAMPLPFAAGIPVTDNIFGSLLRDTLGYSIGPGMMFNPISINPWYNLVSD